jgi:hypothetical protein
LSSGVLFAVGEVAISLGSVVEVSKVEVMMGQEGLTGLPKVD